MVERFSKLGEHGAIWVVIGLAGSRVDRARSDQWLACSKRVLLAYLVNQLIKVVVRRPRPAAARTITHSNLSFPSAHTTTSFCGARMYARMGLSLYPLALAIAVSRLLLKVHHPSNVVAGAALGTVIAR